MRIAGKDIASPQRKNIAIELGWLVGVTLGTVDGEPEGCSDGLLLGDSSGEADGNDVGCRLGVDDGFPLGKSEGDVGYWLSYILVEDLMTLG